MPSTLKKQILLVEDDQLISKSLELSLPYRGFEVISSSTLQEAKKLLDEKTPDLVLLDLQLPDGDGFEFCEQIRKKDDDIPIVMLTARTDEASVVRGIDLGADDYVRKPCGLDELTARMQRLIDRKKRKDSVLKFGSLRLSFTQRAVWVGENPVHLGKREFDILALLMKRPGEAVRRADILVDLEDGSDIYDRTIDSHLSHLRRKLKEAGLLDLKIVPVYGFGYKLIQENEK